MAGHIVWWTSLQRQCHTFRDIGNGCWSNLPPKAGDLGSMVSWPLYPLPLNPHLPAFTERIPSFLPPFLPFLPCSSLGSWLHFHCPEVCPSPICCPCCSLSVVHWLGIAVWCCGGVVAGHRAQAPLAEEVGSSMSLLEDSGAAAHLGGGLLCPDRQL